MRIDMHCHTHEGSPDSKVGIKEYIELLQKQGFNGMLVTDHDSYGGYEYYIRHKAEMPEDFTVFKGIEYDTYEAGHFIVILPSSVSLKVLEHRGLKLDNLIKVVHAHGGILGPAHPCGEPFLSIFSTGKFRKEENIKKYASKIDFIECFNCGEDDPANKRATEIAMKYNLVMTGGSDAHWQDCVGLAYTDIDEDITTNDELIRYICDHKPTAIEGKAFDGTIKARLGKWNKLLVWGFWPYNKFGALTSSRRRNLAMKDNKEFLNSY